MGNATRRLQRKARRIMATWPEPQPAEPPRYTVGDPEADRLLFGDPDAVRLGLASLWAPLGVYNVGAKASERWTLAGPVAELVERYRRGDLSVNEARAFVGLPPIIGGRIVLGFDVLANTEEAKALQSK